MQMATKAGTAVAVAPVKVGLLTVPVGAFATPVKVCPLTLPVTPVNTCPAAVSRSVAAGAVAGHEMTPAGTKPVTRAAGTEAGQETVPVAATVAPAVCESMTTPEFVTSARRLAEAVKPVAVTRTSGTRLAPTPKVPVGRNRSPVAELWMIGSSCWCPVLVAPVNTGFPVGQSTDTEAEAVVPAKVGTPVGQSTDTVPVTEDEAFVPETASLKRLTAFVPEGV